MFSNTIKLQFIFLLTVISQIAVAQKGDIRGIGIDAKDGQPFVGATIQLVGTGLGTATDIDGFYNFTSVPYGSYTLMATAVGYDTTEVEIELSTPILNQGFQMEEASMMKEAVEITTKRLDIAREETTVSVTTVTAKEIKSIPSVGGEADIVQALPTIAGVVSTGDQGGQLYIRGGSPVQNKVLLDGMTIYNPFHSIGFFSVFETETLRDVNVYTGGFGSEFGGRTSGVIDLTTRDGNKKRLAGLVGVSPFLAKAMIEGPMIELNEKGTSMSYLLTAKHSYLDQTSKTLYKYVDSTGLPYNFTDGFGKVSFSTQDGTRASLFGFSFNDRVKFNSIADLNWKSYGGGANFKIVPNKSKMIIGGKISVSNYDINFIEDNKPARRSQVGGFDAGMDFTFYGKKNSELNYGFDVGGFKTNFAFTNGLGLGINQEQNTTELGLFAKYKWIFNKKFILEPGLRMQYYVSLGDLSLEPRLSLKWNATNDLRFKFAGGRYTQNLISAVSERDIVNLFVGFLSAPDYLLEPNSTQRTKQRIQTSLHAIFGVEYDLTKHITFNLEPYYKTFPRLIALNRNKTNKDQPDFVVETGKAYGIDLTGKYQKKNLSVTATYSYAYVFRNDGIQEFPTNFDRRHNVNLFGSYMFGAKEDWELGVRWNMGSGFPFTQTQGFYESFNFSNGLQTDYLGQNGSLGIVFDDKLNGGRLPYYHRLDASLKKSFKVGKNGSLDALISVTNAYNRANIFYFDRAKFTRVNQLPILPSANITYRF